VPPCSCIVKLRNFQIQDVRIQFYSLYRNIGCVLVSWLILFLLKSDTRNILNRFSIFRVVLSHFQPRVQTPKRLLRVKYEIDDRANHINRFAYDGNRCGKLRALIGVVWRRLGAKNWKQPWQIFRYIYPYTALSGILSSKYTFEWAVCNRHGRTQNATLGAIDIRPETRTKRTKDSTEQTK
jgi:hypothetical protein